MKILPFGSFKGVLVIASILHYFSTRVICTRIRLVDSSFVTWTTLTSIPSDVFISTTNYSFHARLATFGPPINGILTRQLVNIRGDPFGCQNSTAVPNPKAINLDYKGKIVLIQRGKCSYTTKIRQIQEAGGTGVIVGDNFFRDTLFTMYADGTTSTYGCSSLR